MAVIALQVGTIRIQFTTGFESQGFAVDEVTGLSEYGEHKMGVPGSNDVTIKGSVLPGVNPIDIRAKIYASTNPYEQFTLLAIHSDGNKYQSLATISSIKCDNNANPCTITVNITRYSGWYGGAVVAINNKKERDGTERCFLNNSYPEGVLYGEFEFVSPVTYEIQLMSTFTQTELADSIVSIKIGSQSSIDVKLERLIPVIGSFSTGLNEGSIIRVTNGLDYHAYLFTAGRVFVLPVLGTVNSGMVQPSTNPSVSLEMTHWVEGVIESGLPENCFIEAVVKTRETFLTI